MSLSFPLALSSILGRKMSAVRFSSLVKTGGQYHWVAVLAPVKSRAVASWFTGWISIGGQIVLTASAAFAGGLQYQALITLNHPDSYVPQRYQGMMFYWLILVYSAAINIWGVKILPHANLTAGVLHVVGFLVITSVVGARSEKHSANYVFVEISNSSGWSSDSLAWLVGLLSCVYPFLGYAASVYHKRHKNDHLSRYDAAAHLAEELPSPARNVPLAMVGSVVANGVLGFIYCLVLLFSLGDLTELLESPTGFPFIQLFLNVTYSQAGATILALIICLIASVANAAGLTSASRTFWAFARDDAAPFSKYFSHVDQKLQVPVRMIVLVSVLQGLLGFIYLGSTTAFNAILSMAIIGTYLSYLLPVIYMVRFGRPRLSPAEYGPFRLGKVGGIVVNIIAIIWLIFAMIFSTFPSLQPVTAQNMNYSTVVLAGWVAGGAIYYFLVARKVYHGPIVETETLTAQVPK
ncbi:hypothetical protein LTR84_000580 [Exophiala bonariae]|uniref:Amino acid permease/ SLC12A domain-containing protein n=1 Tax=Exophiala bonariae TaxID=1690606 RepID=A0AAV9NQY4_9EURO|nr:hypothetical protein LTR84_000580 [Exophiala bonariae]